MTIEVVVVEEEAVVRAEEDVVKVAEEDVDAVKEEVAVVKEEVVEEEDVAAVRAEEEEVLDVVVRLAGEAPQSTRWMLTLFLRSKFHISMVACSALGLRLRLLANVRQTCVDIYEC